MRSTCIPDAMACSKKFRHFQNGETDRKQKSQRSFYLFGDVMTLFGTRSEEIVVVVKLGFQFIIIFPRLHI
jgi:hypothetical protein